ncbi:MAG TPA: hypothetical protein VNJ04_07390 [Gemmatimonadaceae bacterium]|nr:hypothetical protein [Gemmatimonadaceae bacterium]
MVVRRQRSDVVETVDQPARALPDRFRQRGLHGVRRCCEDETIGWIVLNVILERTVEQQCAGVKPTTGGDDIDATPNGGESVPDVRIVSNEPSPDEVFSRV